MINETQLDYSDFNAEEQTKAWLPVMLGREECIQICETMVKQLKIISNPNNKEIHRRRNFEGLLDNIETLDQIIKFIGNPACGIDPFWMDEDDDDEDGFVEYED